MNKYAKDVEIRSLLSAVRQIKYQSKRGRFMTMMYTALFPPVELLPAARWPSVKRTNTGASFCAACVYTILKKHRQRREKKPIEPSK